MIVRSISLDFFRNYLHLEAGFHPGVNVIYGENAQGKTNLLEAVAYLSTASSHRARYDRELIQFGVDHAFVQAQVSARQRDFTLEARLSRGGRRQLFSNGVRLKSAGELAGVLNTVLFCPEDLYLIREGPWCAGGFWTAASASCAPGMPRPWPSTAGFMSTRPASSGTVRKSPPCWTRWTNSTSAWPRRGRCSSITGPTSSSAWREVTPAIHLDFSGGRERLELHYETVKTVTDPEAAPREILPQLLEHQERHRQAELESRQCLSGPHKDDLDVEIDGKSAKTFASQGQTRTAALSLKLACREIFFQETGEWPVLLLDDVLSELDPRRQAFVLGRITSGQVFITCCEDMGLGRLREGKTFHIHAGTLV